MYLRATERKNKNGSTVRYLQLAHNEWDAVVGVSRPRVLYNFGREDQLDRAAVTRLIASLSRVVEPAQALAATAGAELEFSESRPLGGAYVLDGLWQRLGIGKIMMGLVVGRRLDARVERVLFGRSSPARETPPPTVPPIPSPWVDLAVSRLPQRYRRRVLVRLDGAGFSHDLLEHIASGGGEPDRDWAFSVGWTCTDRETDAIARLSTGAGTGGIDQNGDPVADTFVADLTGMLDLRRWQERIPGLRVIVRDEPPHPRYRKRATEREKQFGRRYPLVATNTPVGQIAWLDARHRSHVHVANDVQQAKDLGLDRWPSRHWAVNVAWTPGRRQGREPAGLLPPPRPAQRRAARRRPEAAALPAAAPPPPD